VYALPAARIIENPFTGSLNLLLCAAGMVAHSLRYRAQAVTTTAYFAAFAALAVMPSTSLAVISLIPLAASLLYLAARFGWYTMPLAGLAATYGTCISKGGSGPLVQTQMLLAAYWIIFEAFDLLRTRRRIVSGGAEWISPLNSALFLYLSYQAWAIQAPELRWLAAAYASALFLGVSLVRLYVRPPSTFGSEEDLHTRLRQGSYEGALLVSAVLGGLAIVGRVPGLWASVGLALEAEILYLAGVRFGASFLRRCGITTFVTSLAKLVPAVGAGESQVLGIQLANWTPPALFHAFLFLVNRAVSASGAAFSFTASFLIASVLSTELPDRFIGAAWLAMALVLLEFGLRKALAEFRLQSYLLVIAGTGACIGTSSAEFAWQGLWIAAIAAYLCAFRSRHSALTGTEREFLAFGGGAASAFLACILLWRTVPSDYLGLVWTVLAFLFFELGNRSLPLEMRTLSYAIFVLGISEQVMRHGAVLAKFPGPEIWSTFLGLCILHWVAAARALRFPPANLNPSERQVAGVALSASGAVVALCILWLMLPEPLVTPAWAALSIGFLELALAVLIPAFGWIGNGLLAITLVRAAAVDLAASQPGPVVPLIAALYWTASRTRSHVHSWVASHLAVACLWIQFPELDGRALALTVLMLALLLAGIRRDSAHLRFQSYAVAGLAFLLSVPANLRGESLLIPAAVIACFYAAEYLSANMAVPERQPALAYSIGATLLLGALLYGRVSGGWLSVAWGVQGLLLAAGFPLAERILRLQGLGILVLCILKLFIYDLRNLDTMYRILSFIVLGIIMLAVSWVYTRFRARVRHLLQ
jgi:hypothetical protein